jgi:hypothetical protein
MVLLHRLDEENPSAVVCRLMGAHEALALPRQLRSRRPMNVHAEPLAEPTDA